MVERIGDAGQVAIRVVGVRRHVIQGIGDAGDLVEIGGVSIARRHRIRRAGELGHGGDVAHAVVGVVRRAAERVGHRGPPARGGVVSERRHPLVHGPERIGATLDPVRGVVDHFADVAAPVGHLRDQVGAGSGGGDADAEQERRQISQLLLGPTCRPSPSGRGTSGCPSCIRRSSSRCSHW